MEWLPETSRLCTEELFDRSEFPRDILASLAHFAEKFDLEQRNTEQRRIVDETISAKMRETRVGLHSALPERFQAVRGTLKFLAANDELHERLKAARTTTETAKARELLGDVLDWGKMPDFEAEDKAARLRALHAAKALADSA